MNSLMSSTPLHTFGNLLKQLRKRAGMTQGDLAAAVGYSVSFVCALEQNRRLPDIETVLHFFIPALGLQEEPHLAKRLVESAARARGERPPVAITIKRKTQVVITPEIVQPATHLPEPSTELVGREQEVRSLCRRLQNHSGRLLTLVGPPGIGKTRVGLAMAAQLQSYYKDGVRFVSLAAIYDPEMVAATLLAALEPNETSQKPPKVKLLEFLRHKELLLLLDNFEQIMAAAPLVAELLAECPNLSVIVTSRERLRLRAEQRYKISALALPSAVELFVQRAQAAKPDFVLTPQNQPQIEAICRELDYLPLAIELSAVRFDRFSPQQLLVRLYDHRLNLLNDSARPLPSPQHNLRNAIYRSYALLNTTEKALFRTLGVFMGGFDLTVLSHLGFEDAPLYELHNKSLVHADMAVNQEQRFFLLDTIGEFAREKLVIENEWQAAKQRHTAYFLALAEEGASALHSPDQLAWTERLEAEIHNLRAALTWVLAENNHLEAARFCSALQPFWTLRNHIHEGREWFERTKFALAHYQTVLPPAIHVKFLNNAGSLAFCQTDLGAALTYFDQALALARQTADQWGIAYALDGLSAEACSQRDYARAWALSEESLTFSQAIGDTWLSGITLVNLGELARLQKDFDQANAFYEQSLVKLRATGDQAFVAVTLNNLGQVAYDQGRYDQARAYQTESLQLSHQIGDRRAVAAGLEKLAGVAGIQRQFKIAARLFGAAQALRQAISIPIQAVDQEDFNRQFALVHTQLDETSFDAEYTAGYTMTAEQAVEFALSNV
ncbi:MAG: tetratricopeptide repeat protein [Chloroflexi bacterium]|nr:tetratricopeptide repeat protein [Chloroflexota bacterium]